MMALLQPNVSVVRFCVWALRLFRSKMIANGCREITHWRDLLC
jgi:hypothetical protein